MILAENNYNIHEELVFMSISQTPPHTSHGLLTFGPFSFNTTREEVECIVTIWMKYYKLRFV